MRLDYDTRRGLYLGHLIGGAIGAPILFVAGHPVVAAICLLSGILGAVFLAIEERWEETD